MNARRTKQKVLCTLITTVLFFHLIFLVSGWVAAKDLDINNCVVPSTSSSLMGRASDSGGDITEVNDATKAHLFGIGWSFFFTLFVFMMTCTHIKEGTGFSRTGLGFSAGMYATLANWFLVLAVESGNIVVDKRYNENSVYTRGYVEAKGISAVLLCVLYTVTAVLLLSWEDELVTLSAHETKYLQSIQEADEEEVCTKNIVPELATSEELTEQ